MKFPKIGATIILAAISSTGPLFAVEIGKNYQYDRKQGHGIRFEDANSLSKLNELPATAAGMTETNEQSISKNYSYDRKSGKGERFTVEAEDLNALAPTAAGAENIQKKGFQRKKYFLNHRKNDS